MVTSINGLKQANINEVVSVVFLESPLTKTIVVLSCPFSNSLFKKYHQKTSSTTLPGFPTQFPTYILFVATQNFQHFPHAAR